MNDVRYEYKYQPLGYEIKNNNENNEPKKEEQQAVVNNDYENTNFLNLPKGFKLGG